MQNSKTAQDAFAENFRQCCFESSTVLAVECGKTDADYLAATKEYDRLYEALCSRLGEDETLVNDLDDARNHVQSCSEKYIYQQGFQNCIYLLRWIGLI